MTKQEKIKNILEELDNKITSINCNNYGDCYVDSSDSEEICQWLEKELVNILDNGQK